MKRISSYLGTEDGEILLRNGTRWTVPPGRHLDIAFWSYGDAIESEDYEPVAYLRNLSTQHPIPARRVDGGHYGDASGREVA